MTNRSINRLQVEIEDLKGQKATLEAAVPDAELLEEIAIKDANGPDGGCPEAGQAGHDQQLRESQELALNIDVATFHKPLEDEESGLESGMQSFAYPYKDHQ